MAKVSLSLVAMDDLDKIFEYIANDSEFYAQKVVNNILKRIRILEAHIKIGKVVREFENDAIREITEGATELYTELKMKMKSLLYTFITEQDY